MAWWVKVLHEELEGSQFKSHLSAWSVFGIQPRYEAPGDLRVESRIKRSDLYWVKEAAPSTVAQSWQWVSQEAVKKKYILEREDLIFRSGAHLDLLIPKNLSKTSVLKEKSTFVITTLRLVSTKSSYILKKT